MMAMMTILTIIKPCCSAVRENFFRPQKTVGQLRDRLETNLVDFFVIFYYGDQDDGGDGRYHWRRLRFLGFGPN